MYRTPHHIQGQWIPRLAGLLAAALLFGVTTVRAQQILQDTHAPSSTGALTLDQCIDIALQRDSSVLIAQRQSELSDAQSLSV